MKAFKLISYLFLSLSLAACSTTSFVEISAQDSHYYESNFTHSNFSTYDKSSQKKTNLSDRDLMIALLNRPLPEDQRMMLAFSRNQAQYLPDSELVGVKIKGDKKEEHNHKRVKSQFAFMIENDVNGVAISAMPK